MIKHNVNIKCKCGYKGIMSAFPIFKKDNKGPITVMCPLCNQEIVVRQPKNVKNTTRRNRRSPK